MQLGKVEHLFTGKAKTYGDDKAERKMDREWTTAIYRRETDEAVHLTETGFQNDEVGDKKNHGGPEKAVSVTLSAITQSGKKNSGRRWGRGLSVKTSPSVDWTKAMYASVMCISSAGPGYRFPSRDGRAGALQEGTGSWISR